jgi:large subunit ribosomal protein L4e
LVTVQSPSGKHTGVTIKLPEVLLAPIRSDIVNDVHTKMNKNHRQPYAVSSLAGEDTSATSWGTGRAVSRIPRVSGGGTHRSGQGAFGNMCRKGRMFAPTKIWRRWHVSVNVDQKRYATCSALAASAVAPLVLARGHRISQIAEVPLVVADNDINGISKTKDAVSLLVSLGCEDELSKVKDSRHVRPGKGKARNRRYVQAKGPLNIHNKHQENSTLIQAFRNIQGVELANVTSLNFLQLAPGGHVGRFVIWTESAFKLLDEVFGTRKEFSKHKKSFKPPRGSVTNSDISRIINSHEVQTKLKSKKKPEKRFKHVNPLTNFRRMVKLNPYAEVKKRTLLLNQERKFKRSDEERKRDRSLRHKKRKLKERKNPHKSFKKLLLTQASAPLRSDVEVGVLVGQK